MVNREAESRAEPKDALIGRVVGGRYRIEALLGEGGMGAVYRAEQLDLKKKVAVKVLHREMVLNSEVVARFEREAVASGRIAHPHVASAFDFGRLEDGVYFLALEFIEGQSLGRIMDQQAPLPERMALRIARQIADALAAAHAAGVVHRDLKPENVMLLDRPPGEEFVKVLDFGIAKLRSSNGAEKEQPLTQLGTVFGTPEYMSPEQARGMEVDGRSDLYTLGLMLYEMLSGASPFSHEDMVVILARQLSMQAPPLPNSVSRPTRELVANLLKKERDERPKTAVEVRDAIAALLSRPEARRDSVPELDVSFSDELGRTGVISRADTGRSPVEDAPTLMAAPRSKVDSAPNGDAVVKPEAAGLGQRSRTRRGSHVALFGYAFPKRFLFAFAGLIALSAGLTLLLLWTSGASTAPNGSGAGQNRAAELTRLAQKAMAGDRFALATLGAVPAAERSEDAWRGLTRGHCANGESDRCLAFLRDAVKSVPSLVDDPLFALELRSLALSEAHGPEALELAATAFGASGADLLYDVANDRALGKSASAVRARELLQEERVRKAMSPALSAAVRLAAAVKAPRCNEIKKLLGELAPAFDQRALANLNRFSERRGCGLLGLGDCYSCLRSGRELKSAIEAAKARPAPKFDADLPALGSAAPSASTRGAAPSASTRGAALRPR